MNKFKKILLGALSVLTLGVFVAAGTKVNAESYEYGTYRVTTTTNTNDTATWDFTDLKSLGANKYIGSGDDNLGIINTATNSNSRITMKYSEGDMNIPKDQTSGSDPAVMYIPVPASSAGTITIVCTTNNNSRTLTLYANNVATDRTIAAAKNSGASLTYTASDITTYNNNSYLLFKSLQTDGDIKIYTIKIVLTTGAFESTAEIYNVNIYDGTTKLKTYEVEDGTSFNASTFKMWGYSLDFYTDSELSTAYTTTSITSDTDLYVQKTADTTDYGYNLTAAMITTLSGVYNTSSEIEITDYYTKGSDVSCALSYLGIKNTAAKSVVITVPEGGLNITVSCSTGGGSDRNILLYKTTYGSNEVTDFTTLLPANDYTARNVSTTLDEGVYYLAGSNDVRVYSITMTEITLADNTTAAVFAEKNTAGDTLRFVGTITGINDLADIDEIELILTLDDKPTNQQILLTKCYTSVEGASQTCAEADGTYYVIFRITGVTGLTGTITKQLKITFTDGSTTLSEVTNTVLE